MKAIYSSSYEKRCLVCCSSGVVLAAMPEKFIPVVLFTMACKVVLPVMLI